MADNLTDPPDTLPRATRRLPATGPADAQSARRPGTRTHRRRKWKIIPPTTASTICAMAVVAGTVFAGGLLLSTHMNPGPAVHTAALFVHLASLVLGFGAVLVADYLMLLWLIGRSSFIEAMNAAGRLHLPVWAGLCGLVFSGNLLEPHLSAGMTQVKLTLVLALTVNGIQLPAVADRIRSSAGILTGRLVVWAGTTTAVSQVCWWGATWIGFWTANHPH